MALALIALATLATLAGCKDKGGSDASPLEPDTIYPAAAPCVAGAPSTLAAKLQLPDLTLACLTGAKSEVNLRAITNGKPTIVTLWAHWCGPCLKELPAMQRVYAAGTVSVVGINSLDDAQPAVAMMKELKLTFPSLWDFSAHTLDRLKIRRALPATLFVDPSGEVRKVYQEAGFDDTTLAAAIHEYLGV